MDWSVSAKVQAWRAFQIKRRRGQGTRGLHQNQHTYSCKSYQRISVLVIEVIFKPQNIAKVPNSDTHTMQIPSIDHIHAIDP